MDRIATQGLQKLLSPNGGNALRRDEPCKDLLRISPSKVEKGVALWEKLTCSTRPRTLAFSPNEAFELEAKQQEHGKEGLRARVTKAQSAAPLHLTADSDHD